MNESLDKFKMSEDLARKMALSAKKRLDELKQDYYEFNNPSHYSEEEYENRKSSLEESLKEYYLKFPQLKDEVESDPEQLSVEVSSKAYEDARERVKILNKKFQDIDSEKMTEQEEDKEGRIIGNEIEEIFIKYPGLRIEDEAGYLD